MDGPASSISYGLSMNNIDAIALADDKKLTSNFRSQNPSYNMLKQTKHYSGVYYKTIPMEWKIQDNK